MKADQFRAGRCAEAQFKDQMVVVKKIIEEINMSMNMNKKKFPLSVGDIMEILASNGCRASMVRPHTKIEMSTIDTPISIPSGEVEVDISGVASCFLSAMESIFSKCSTDHADAVKDQESAELRKQLAAAQNDVKQLRAALEKIAQEASGAANDAGVGSDADKQKQNDGWIEWSGGASWPSSVPLGARIEYKLRDGFVGQRPCVSNMLIWSHSNSGGDIIAYRIVKERNQEAAKVSPPSIGSKSHSPGNNGVAHHTKDVWIDWHGGECPVRGYFFVEYKMRGCRFGVDPAHLLNWKWSHAAEDIIAYRVVK